MKKLNPILQPFNNSIVGSTLFILPTWFFGKEIAQIMFAGNKDLILFEICFSLLGSLLAASIFLLVRHKKIPVVLTSLAIWIGILIIVMNLILAQDSRKLIERKWSEQTLHNLTFSAPFPLQNAPSSIPDSLSWFYQELELFVHEKRGLTSIFMHTEISDSNMAIEYLFSSSLNTFMSNNDLKDFTMKLDNFDFTDAQISSKITWNDGKEERSGFGFMVKQNNQFNSLWLIPTEKSFSNGYIDKFYKGISIQELKKTTNE